MPFPTPCTHRAARLCRPCPCSSRGDAGPAPVDSPWGGWAVGYGLAGQALGDGNAHGADYSTAGTLVAIQRPLDFASRLGLFYGYGGFHVTTQTVDQSAKVDDHQAGTFFVRELDDDYWLLAGSFGYDAYVARRAIAFDSIEATALGDHYGWQSAAYLERGHTFRGE